MNPEFLKIAQMSEDQAREMIEAIRWADGIVCPKCGSDKGAYKLQSKPETKNKIRPGVYKCKECRKKFTVTIGTIFEDSHIPLDKWLLGIYLMNASKKGISAHQLHRMLDITYKSAWFMCHRIRYAMTQDPLEKLLGTVEADETYIGGKERNKHASKRTKGSQGRSTNTKTPVAVLVERERGGKSKAKKVTDVGRSTLQEHIRENVTKDSHIMTDEWLAYQGLSKEYAGHSVVDHGKGEYVNGIAYTNTAESWIALLKRGIVGTFHHVSKEHLDRYIGEFEHRWNNRLLSDGERTVKTLEGINGKRLIYKETINQKGQAN